MKFKTPKSEIEIELKKMLKEASDIVDESYLTTNDAKKILNYGYKMLEKVREIRESRDKWRNDFKSFKKIEGIKPKSIKKNLTKKEG